MIPFTPRSTEEHRQRYPVALEPVYDCESIVLGVGIRPGEVAANLFDWPDGLRLIVSRDRLEDGEVVVHVSASVVPGERLARYVRDGVLSATDFVRLVERRFAELSGERRHLAIAGFSEGKGIPHWYLET